MTRKISVGFKEPKTLDGEIIYSTLEKEIGCMRAHAISKYYFRYSVRATAGNVLNETTKDITNAEGSGENFRDYERFIDEIASKNNGVVNYSQAIKDGSEAYRVMNELTR